MIIIAFSNKTSKILPRIFCGELKHVAPIVVQKDKIILYQFVKPGTIVPLPILARDINILMSYGWRFIWLSDVMAQPIKVNKIYTCVQLAKHIIAMKNPWIQTPNALYKQLKF